MSNTHDDEIQRLHAEVARRQYYDRRPRRIAEVLNTLIARRGYSELEAAGERDEAWKAAVGKPMSAYSRIGGIRRGVVEVTVSNSAALQELTFRKAELIRKISAALPDQKIHGMRFRVHGSR